MAARHAAKIAQKQPKNVDTIAIVKVESLIWNFISPELKVLPETGPKIRNPGDVQIS